MAGGRLADAADLLPWPNVRGKRCLDVAAPGYSLARVLEDRGAVAVREVDPDPGALGAMDGPYDVVTAGGVLSGAHDPTALARALHQVTRGVLLSCEPIELWTSVLARGKPLFSLDGAAGLHFNGAGHRQLFELAGFATERVSKPFTLAGDATATPGAARFAIRLLTGSREAGVLHRALLVRPLPLT